MHYGIYLAGVLCLSLFSLMFSPGHISFSNLYYFLDYQVLLSMSLVCILALFCTKLFKPFGHSFLFIFGKTEPGRSESEQALLSIKTVTLCSIFYGIILGIAELVKFVQSLSAPGLIGTGINLSLLPIFYAMLICILLLPIQIALQKHLCSNCPSSKVSRISKTR